MGRRPTGNRCSPSVASTLLVSKLLNWSWWGQIHGDRPVWGHESERDVAKGRRSVQLLPTCYSFLPSSVCLWWRITTRRLPSHSWMPHTERWAPACSGGLDLPYLCLVVRDLREQQRHHVYDPSCGDKNRNSTSVSAALWYFPFFSSLRGDKTSNKNVFFMYFPPPICLIHYSHYTNTIHFESHPRIAGKIGEKSMKLQGHCQSFDDINVCMLWFPITQMSETC